MFYCTQYIDKSKRKPYVCGACGRDISHPCHQPNLPLYSSTATVRNDRIEISEPVPIAMPEPDPAQMTLFTVTVSR